MSKKESIHVQGTEVTLLSKPDGRDYLCITDIARYKNPLEPKDVVKNWMRSRNTVEFLGLWEKIHNPNFKGVEFDPLLFEAGREHQRPAYRSGTFAGRTARATQPRSHHANEIAAGQSKFE
jgi:hypothetical protein